MPKNMRRTPGPRSRNDDMTPVSRIPIELVSMLRDQMSHLMNGPFNSQAWSTAH
jgi:hypothetical protein